MVASRSWSSAASVPATISLHRLMHSLYFALPEANGSDSKIELEPELVPYAGPAGRCCTSAEALVLLPVDGLVVAAKIAA